jgi:hypothetical protein
MLLLQAVISKRFGPITNAETPKSRRAWSKGLKDRRRWEPALLAQIAAIDISMREKTLPPQFPAPEPQPAAISLAATA